MSAPVIGKDPYYFEPLRTVKKSINGTEKRTRTSTGLPPLAPEASVSTNSTTSAIDAKLLKIAARVNYYFTFAGES